MGLLDALFNQDSYGGQGGGLLDFLKTTQAQNSQYQPGPGFAPQQPQTPGRSFDNSMFDPATFAPNQAQPIAVGNYQMPRIGDAPQFAPDPAALPQNAQSAQGQLPPQAAPQQPMQQPMQQQTLPTFMGGPQQGLGFGDRMNAGLQNFANAGGPLQALAGGISGLMSGNRTDPLGMQQQNLKAQYDALVPTLGPQKAMLAVMNPEAGKVLLQEALTNKQEWGVISDNPVEGRKYGFINKFDQTINDKPVGQGGATAQPGGLLAQGATYDPNRSGEDYLNQFSPEVKAAVKAYINGDVLPTGNARKDSIATQAKSIAQKYGSDMGIPVSDALFAEKRKYRTELGTNSPNSAGGQAKAFNQGISHMTALADNLEKLDNSNGMGIPAVAGLVNSARQGMSNTQSAISDEAKSLGQTVAGEVGKLFSGSAGGGVHERELTRERFDTVKSKPQLAAALRATLETMDGGLKALEQRRDAVLGPNSGVELVGNETKANIAKIQGAIDRLEGKSGSASPTIQEGATATNPQTGQKITFKNGKWQ